MRVSVSSCSVLRVVGSVNTSGLLFKVGRCELGVGSDLGTVLVEDEGEGSGDGSEQGEQSAGIPTRERGRQRYRQCSEEITDERRKVVEWNVLDTHSLEHEGGEERERGRERVSLETKRGTRRNKREKTVSDAKKERSLNP